MHGPPTPWALLFLSLPTLSSAAPGCKSKPGDSCKTGTALCLDARTELACQDGKFIAAQCKGPKGCVDKGAMIECDVSANVEGDVCSTQDENKGTCGADGKSMVSCHSGKYEVMACRGPAGCKPEGKGSTCDNTLGEEGDRCVGAGNTCATDGKRMLSCEGGRFALKWRCGGPAGCKGTGNGELSCDSSVAEVGDACDTEGGACTADRKQLLRCEGGKFGVQSHCRGPEGCKDAGDQLTCDSSLGEVGDPCDPDDAACQVDGKAFLGCKEGKLAVTRACRCAVVGDTVGCR